MAVTPYGVMVDAPTRDDILACYDERDLNATHIRTLAAHDGGAIVVTDDGEYMIVRAYDGDDSGFIIARDDCVYAAAFL